MFSILVVIFSLFVISCGEPLSRSNEKLFGRVRSGFVPKEVLLNDISARRLHAWDLFDQFLENDGGGIVGVQWIRKTELFSIFKAYKAAGITAPNDDILKNLLEEFHSTGRHEIAMNDLETVPLGDGKSNGYQLTLFSPEFITHILKHEEEFRNKLAGEPFLIPSFPPEAMMAKTVWVVDESQIPSFLAGEKQVKEVLNTGIWIPEILSLRPPNPQVLWVEGIPLKPIAVHLVTKELPHWLWSTLWIAPDGKTDWGEDKPENSRNLKNFKMCSVADFSETASFKPLEQTAPDLFRSLRAAHTKTTSWCSNPYLESRVGATNCVGCHQHAPFRSIPDVDSTNEVSASDFVMSMKNFKVAIDLAFKKE